MSFKIDPIDWHAEMQALLYAQYRRTVTWPIMAELQARQAQDVEDAGQSLLTIPSIDDSEGVQLDTLGALLRQLRNVVDDPTYRLYLRARVLANNSSGTVEEFYAIFRALFGDDVLMSVATETASTDVKTFVATIRTPMTNVQASVAVSFLGDAKDAGARALFLWQTVDGFQVFRTADGTYVTAQNIVGATSLQIMDVTLPASGSVVIDPGLATQETRAYTRTDATHIAVAALGQVHPVGAFCELVGDIGMGFPQSTALSVAALAAATSITVSATAGFSASGSLIIDEGLPNEETVTYTTSSGTVFATSPLAFAHSQRAAVVQVGTGGSLAGAAQA